MARGAVFLNVSLGSANVGAAVLPLRVGTSSMAAYDLSP